MTRDTQPLTVLVVDDEPTVCRSVEKILSRKGYRLVGATSVEQALDILEAGPPVSLALVDLMMPGVSGMELIRVATERWPRLPIVVITGYASVASAVEATRLGAVDYLAKPFTPEELEATVASALARGTWRPEPAAVAKAPRPASASATDDDPIDVDMPFSAREVSAVTGEAYVEALGRGDLPCVGRWPADARRRRRVLAVDDETVVVNAMRRSLEGRRYRVDEAFSGRAALAQVSTQVYDLVLLDLRMPDLDGLELLPSIRARQPGVPVIVVTGYASIDTAVEAIQRGAADYLAKPFTPDELRRAADRVCARE
jgi:DNA-binding NtrC family response regulator